VSVQPAFVENRGDWERSVQWARERANAGDDDLEICPWCGCEVDTEPQPHRPGCEGIGKARVSSGPVLADGVALQAKQRLVHPAAPVRDLSTGIAALERMDAGEPQEPERDVELVEDSFDEGADDLDREEGPRSPTPGSGGSDEEPPAMQAPTPEATDAAGEPELEPGRAPNRELSSRSLSVAEGGWSRKRKTREEAIAALQRFAAEHGRAPARSELGRDYISASTVDRLFGGYPEGLDAAGLEAPTEQGLSLLGPRASGSQDEVAKPKEAAPEERETLSVGAGSSRSSDVELPDLTEEDVAEAERRADLVEAQRHSRDLAPSIEHRPAIADSLIARILRIDADTIRDAARYSTNELRLGDVAKTLDALADYLAQDPA
jgi:hypothetical protein